MGVPLAVDMVINEPPLFHKAMDTQDRTHVAGQVSTATSDGQVLGWIEAKAIDHEIAIGQVAEYWERERERERSITFKTSPLTKHQSYVLTFQASLNDSSH